jgi:vacuolar-type H+-ATPase subunit I/STV1
MIGCLYGGILLFALIFVGFIEAVRKGDWVDAGCNGGCFALILAVLMWLLSIAI